MGAGSSSGAFNREAREGTEHHIRAEESWQSCGMCDTCDHSLGFTIFLLRCPACSRECNQCFFFSATPSGGQGISFEVHRMLLLVPMIL